MHAELWVLGSIQTPILILSFLKDFIIAILEQKLPWKNFNLDVIHYEILYTYINTANLLHLKPKEL